MAPDCACSAPAPHQCGSGLTASAELVRLYDGIQNCTKVMAGSSALAEEVTFRANRPLPVHRWFPFKEGFSAHVLKAVGVDTTHLRSPDEVFIDPFCGSGTTLLAGDLDENWSARRIGFEINPFLLFVSDTKLNWRNYRPGTLHRLSEQVLDDALRADIPQSQWPALSTLHRVDMFAPERVSQLLDVIERIRTLPTPESNLLLLGVAAATEKLSFFRKDGRALRIVRKPSELAEREEGTVGLALKRQWQDYESDLQELVERRRSPAPPLALYGEDGRTMAFPSTSTRVPPVGLIAYSPPYLNHIDYTEVYKVESWLLGHIRSSDAMLTLRKSTLRSHGSVSVRASSASLPLLVRRALAVASTEVAQTGGKWHSRFGNVACGYFSDLQTALLRQYDLLCPGRQVVCVVANTAHGAAAHRVPIAVDLLLVEIARGIGFEIDRLIIARQLVRRDHLNRFLRESVLVLRRPGNAA